MSSQRETPPMMKCGHAANAVDGSEKPVCVICVAIAPGWNEIAETPDLTNRKARCSYYKSKCRTEVDSALGLAFFEHLPEQEFDRFYCGCYGWD